MSATPPPSGIRKERVDRADRVEQPSPGRSPPTRGGPRSGRAPLRRPGTCRNGRGTRCGCPAPIPTWRRSTPATALVPLVVGVDGLEVDVREARGMGQQMAERRLVLPSALVAGDVGAHRDVEVDELPLMRDHHHRRRDGLGERVEHVRDVAIHRPVAGDAVAVGAVEIGPASPGRPAARAGRRRERSRRRSRRR